MQIKFSNWLFCDRKEVPLNFCVEGSPERDSIISLIERGGGKVVNNKDTDQNTLRLAPEGFTIINIDNVYLALDYITACCLKNKILPFASFVFHSEYKYSESFREDLQNLVNSLELQPQGRVPISQYNTLVTKKCKLGSDIVDPTSSDDEMVTANNYGTANSSLGASNRNVHYRQAYSMAECKAIVEYIASKKAYSIVKGNKLWKKMESRNICPERTWQSLKEHFRKKIVPWINRYTSNEDVINAFRNISSDNWKMANKLISLDDDDQVSSGSNNASAAISTWRRGIVSTRQQNCEHTVKLSQVPSSVKLKRNIPEKVSEGRVQNTENKDSKVVLIDSSSDGEDIDNGQLMNGNEPMEESTESDCMKYANVGKKLVKNKYGSVSNINEAQSLCNAESKPSTSSALTVALNTDTEKCNKSLGAHEKETMKWQTNFRDLGNVEANLHELFGEQGDEASDSLMQEFHTLQFRVIRCFALAIQPSLESPPEDFVSGYCSACFSLTVYSKLDFRNYENTTPLCTNCLEINQIATNVNFIFWVVLELTTQNGNFEVTVAGNDGRDFFGCTEKEFLTCANLKNIIRQKISQLLHPRKRWCRLEGNFTISEDNSAFPNRIFLSNCSLDCIV